MQEKVWAKRAFHLRFGHCERVHADHFRDGFLAGYCNVCDGKGGQIPTLPPEKYWGFNYRNQEGAEKQNAWFAGFESGAESARTDGSGSFQGIQIARQVEEAIVQAEEMQDQHAGIYREYIVDMAPVTQGSGQTLAPLPQANMPYNLEQEDAMNRAAGNPAISGPAQPVPMPSLPAGFDANQPLPVQSVPIVPGASR